MRDVIHQMMEAENEAKCLLREARTQAGLLHDEARKQAEIRKEQVRNDTRIEAQSLVEQAVREAEADKAGQLDRAATEIEESIQLDATVRENSLAAVFAFLCGSPQNR